MRDRFFAKLDKVLFFRRDVTKTPSLLYKKTDDYPWLMFPGLSLIYSAGLSIMVTNIQVSNLFVANKSTIVGLLMGAVDTSGAVSIIIKVAFEAGFSRRDSFLILCALQFTMIMFSTMAILPKTYITPPTWTDYNDKDANIDEQKEVIQNNNTGASIYKQTTEPDEQTELLNANSVKRLLKEPLFYTQLIWSCLVALRFFYFMGSMNSYLNRILHNDDTKVSYFTNVAFSIFMGGIVMSLVCGAMNDWQTKIFSIRGNSIIYKARMPVVLPLTITSVISVTSSVLVLINNTRLLYPIFICIVIQRSFLFSMIMVFLKSVCNVRLIFLVNGITMACIGVFCCLQYGLFSWSAAYHNAPQHVEILLLCAGLLSLLHPGYIFWCGFRAEKNAMPLGT